MTAEKIKVDLGERGYDILIRRGLIKRCPELISSVLPTADRIVVITNIQVNRLYGREVVANLTKAGFEVPVIEVGAGEKYKSLTSANKIYGRLLELGANRQTVIISLGGGVIGDLAGFIAATYMRGLSYIQIPTTLLAQVDSGIGGKTAVNHRLAKNIIGAFHQPRLVVVDPDALTTLAPREMRTGLSEVIKYALISGGSLLKQVSRMLPLHKDINALVPVIKQCCRYKAEIIVEDERDLGRRAVLNYGHTIGHAIEAVAGYRRYNHGEAVALGMMGAAQIAGTKGWLNKEAVMVHSDLIRSAGLPQRMIKVDAQAVYGHLKLDKKRIGKSDRLVLLKGLGRPVLTQVNADLIKKTIAGLS